MVPYTPLFEVVLSKFGKPVVATSGNVTESPIVYNDADALRNLGKLADLIVSNDRDIVVPQDDSVVRYSQDGTRIILRRSRGMAPSFFHSFQDLPDDNILCMGASMKSTFCYLTGGSIYVSQYLGDLESYDTEQAFRHTLDHFLSLFGNRPDLILIDKHPDYFSSRLGVQMAKELGVSIYSVQHHEAHLMACLGEHDLLGNSKPVMGVIWDGLGYGMDSNIWGGECFLFQEGTIERKDSLNYFPLLAGDRMSLEPRISALALLSTIRKQEYIRSKFSREEWAVYSTLLGKGGQLQTSSMGRVFDCVSSLLGLMDVSTYEGEAAMFLEQTASRFEGHTESYDLHGWNMVPVLKGILGDLEDGDPVERIAFRFHKSLAKMIILMADRNNVKDIAFSGGVFQNALLVDLLKEYGEGYSLYFHKDLSPNDENVSFGQLMHYTGVNHEAP